jgi:hypothetical protein
MGGQTLLIALTTLGLPIRSLYVFDLGICRFIAVGAILQLGRREWLAIGAALIVAWVSGGSVNSGAAISGALFLFLLYLLLLEIQSHVPLHVPFLAMSDDPYLFDFERNKVVLVDLPTVAGPVDVPPPGASPEQYERAIADFERLGIDYFVLVDTKKSRELYNEPRAESMRNDHNRVHEVLSLRLFRWFAFVHYVLDHRAKTATVGDYAVVDLRTKAPSHP